MDINEDRLAEQVELAYSFFETLHGQAIDLIKTVEAQLAQEAELRFLQPGGYRYCINPQSYSLAQPQVPMADYFGVFLRHYEGQVENTPFDGQVPPIGFLKVVFREHELKHPEVRFGVLTQIRKPQERAEGYPATVEIIANHLAHRALVGPSWSDSSEVRRRYQHSYVTLEIRGRGIRLAQIPDSEAIAQLIVDPLLAMFGDTAE